MTWHPTTTGSRRSCCSSACPPSSCSWARCSAATSCSGADLRHRHERLRLLQLRQAGPAGDAQPITEVQAPQIHAIVRELATTAHQPMPRLYIATPPTPTRSPPDATAQTAVCVTTGILDLLSEAGTTRRAGPRTVTRLQPRHPDLLCGRRVGVGGDPRWPTWRCSPGAFGGNREGGTNPLALLLVSLLGPIAATLIRLAVSHSRGTEPTSPAPSCPVIRWRWPRRCARSATAG